MILFQRTNVREKRRLKRSYNFPNLVKSTGNFYSNHTSKFPEIHTEIIGCIDLINSNHYRYPSLMRNGFVITKSSSLSPY